MRSKTTGRRPPACTTHRRVWSSPEHRFTSAIAAAATAASPTCVRVCAPKCSRLCGTHPVDAKGVTVDAKGVTVDAKGVRAKVQQALR